MFFHKKWCRIGILRPLPGHINSKASLPIKNTQRAQSIKSDWEGAALARHNQLWPPRHALLPLACWVATAVGDALSQSAQRPSGHKGPARAIRALWRAQSSRDEKAAQRKFMVAGARGFQPPKAQNAHNLHDALGKRISYITLSRGDSAGSGGLKRRPPSQI